MDSNDIKRVFSINLNALIAKHKETQLDLAKVLGVAPSSVSGWCKGVKIPRIDKIDKIAEHYGVTRSALLEDRLGSDFEYDRNDSDLIAYLEELKTRPELKMLFDVTKGCTKEDVEKAVRIIEAALGK